MKTKMTPAAAISYLTEVGYKITAALNSENTEVREIAEAARQIALIYERRADDITRLEAERDAALAKVPKWISVDERLPDKSGYYLYRANSPCIGLKNGIGASYYQRKSKIWKKVYRPCVTHWMPLPEPPEEQKETKHGEQL